MVTSSPSSQSLLSFRLTNVAVENNSIRNAESSRFSKFYSADAAIGGSLVEESNISDADYASRIDLISKVFGIDAAERYFEGLSLASKTPETYTSLLHAYAGSKQTERAEALFDRIIETDNLSFGAITYNEMMTLYMSVGKLRKCPRLSKCKSVKRFLRIFLLASNL
ncbi:unnamed protein product [Arabis nemorensis]|uniref:Pentacotripeptide-repeat region of PRORP domain-containing protein n=1 Tax=Arabis nemorensis TaxID=586526 RepID=A0A565CJA0_9BRAS|nr:unnamed protein product [Arabis nemorensis]